MLNSPNPLLESVDSRTSKNSYEVMNPFVSGVTRSNNVRLNSPLSKIVPYTQR